MESQKSIFGKTFVLLYSSLEETKESKDDYAIVHPLSHSWNMWIRDRNVVVSADKFEESLVKVSEAILNLFEPTFTHQLHS